MDYCCKRGMSLKYKTARKIENSENPAHNTDFLGPLSFAENSLRTVKDTLQFLLLELRIRYQAPKN